MRLSSLTQILIVGEVMGLLAVPQVFEEAILHHGGEVAKSRSEYLATSERERQAFKEAFRKFVSVLNGRSASHLLKNYPLPFGEKGASRFYTDADDARTAVKFGKILTKWCAYT